MSAKFFKIGHPRKFISAKVFQIGYLWNFVFAKFKNWLSTKVYAREITKKIWNFLIFHHTFFKWHRCKEIATYVFSCNFFIYLFYLNEVDSKSACVKEKFLYNFHKCQKSPLCEHSLKWKLNWKMINSKIVLSTELFAIIKLIKYQKYQMHVLDIIDVDNDVLEVIVVISRVIEYITTTKNKITRIHDSFFSSFWFQSLLNWSPTKLYVYKIFQNWLSAKDSVREKFLPLKWST